VDVVFSLECGGSGGVGMKIKERTNNGGGWLKKLKQQICTSTAKI